MADRQYLVTLPGDLPDIYSSESVLCRALDQAGFRPVSVVEAPSPVKVVVTVKGGIAEIASNGRIDIVHADLDREGDLLTSSEIDAILAFGLLDGCQPDVDAALASARGGLEQYLDIGAGAPLP